jgi:hypothetical protein
MGTNDAGSVMRWIGDPKVRGEAASQRLWERYRGPSGLAIRHRRNKDAAPKRT